MKELLKTIIKDWQRTFPRTEVKDRKLEVPLNSKKIITLIGPRRSGKTFYSYQLINRLLSTIESSRIIYLNFEDERIDLTAAQLRLIVEAYYELYPENQDKELYFFFDEIQEIDGWEKFVRRLYDTISTNIFITGSSAKMLGKEIATALRGRNLVYTLFPLSFDEYCKFQNVDVTDVYSTASKSILKSHLEKYIRRGGYPETVSMDDELIQRTLQSYFDVMLFRDIVERHAIPTPLVLRQFLKKVLNNVPNKLSVHKFYNELKSQGLTTSKNAIYEYLEYAIDCFLLFTIYPYETSQPKQLIKNRKAYAIDTGLVNALSYRYSEDRGKLLENVIFMHLARQEKTVHYLNDKHECDFIVQKELAITEVIQVCHSLQEPATRQRELRGLLHAASLFNLPEAHIITLDEEEDFEVEGKKVFVRPCWKWLLGK
jgi:hypothetical protein